MTAPTSLLKQQQILSAQTAGIPTVCIGDSTVANGFGTDGGVVSVTNGFSQYTGGTYASSFDNSFIDYTNIILYSPWNILHNAGIGGDSTTGVLSRMQTDCLQYGPKLVVLAAGTNDIVQATGPDAATVAAGVIANLSRIFDLCAAAGAQVLAFTVLPRLIFTVDGTATALQLQIRQPAAILVNQWLIAEKSRRRELLIVNTWGVFGDPLTGQPLSGYTWDGTHPTNVGAFVIGKEASRQLAGVFPMWPYIPMGAAEAYLLNASAIVRNDNPLMAAGTGGTMQTGVTGAVAQGFDCGRGAGTPTVAASVVAHPDGLGYRQKLVITFAAAGDMVYLGTPNLNARWVAGALLEGQCDFEVEANSAQIINRMTLSCGSTVSGVGHSAKCMDQTAGRSPGNIPYGSGGFKGRMRTFRVTQPQSGACSTWNNRLNIYASAAGTVTVYVSLFAARMIV